MAPLITLVAVTLLLRLAGAAGMSGLRSWHMSLRGGLAAMFFLTGASHFTSMRADFIAIIPPVLPYPDLLVTVSGALELLGAAGLLYRRTVPWAAAGLALLLVVIFPANVYAALAGLTLSGEPATALLPRTLTQLVFITAALLVLLPYVRSHRQRERRQQPTRQDNPTIEYIDRSFLVTNHAEVADTTVLTALEEASCEAVLVPLAGPKPQENSQQKGTS